MKIAVEILRVVNVLIFTLLLLQSAMFAWQIVVAWFEVRRSRVRAQRADPFWVLTSDITLPVSLLVPAHNEQATIVENIHSMLSLHYPEFEVIVINDGSTDRTLQVMVESLGLEPMQRVHLLAVQCKKIRGLYGSPRHPRLLVVDKENGGKSDALNAGINLARYPLFCAVDADSLLDHDSLLQVVRPFIEEPDRMIAVGGRIQIVNGCTVRAGQVVETGLPRQLLPLLQTIEYIRSFLISRLAWSRLDAMLIISGAFGVFKRSAAVAVGGYSHNTVGEDMEIVVKLHRYHRERNLPYQMRYVPESVCWTEAPPTLRLLRRQRTRWQRGMIETISKHRDMIFNARYGPSGTIGMGYFFLFDLVGPLVELFGYVMIPISFLLGHLDTNFFLAYLMLTFTYGIFLSTCSLAIEMVVTRTAKVSDLWLLTLVAVAENFGYRQLNNIWRLEGIVRFLRGEKGWGQMDRSGFLKSTVGEKEE